MLNEVRKVLTQLGNYDETVVKLQERLAVLKQRALLAEKQSGA